MSYHNQAFYSSKNDGINTKIQQNQAQVRDLTDIMQQNIEKAMQRDINLQVLENNVENLQENASQFQQTSYKTKRWYIWKNRKWTIILVIVIVIILALLALAIGLGVGLNKN